jgi:hypothetical protein
MDAHSPDNDPHAKFRNLCMLYGDYNRAVFLEEILRFIAGFGATKAELAAIRSSVQRTAKQLAKRRQRGRPRAAKSAEWMQKAITAAYRRRVLGLTWSQVVEGAGMKPTKPNVRTVQRQIAQVAEIIADAIPPEFWETVIVGGRYSHKLREGTIDSSRLRLWLISKTGLRFDTRPEECKKLVEALLR